MSVKCVHCGSTDTRHTHDHEESGELGTWICEDCGRWAEGEPS